MAFQTQERKEMDRKDETSPNPISQGIIKLQSYKHICVIGLCDHGDVRFCRDKIDNSSLVLKRLYKSLLTSDQEATKLCTSLNHLLQLSHPFILHTRDIFQDETTVYILSDFCGGGNLYDYVKTFGHLNEMHVRFVAVQLLLVLQYIHSQNIIFSNLICENVLLDERGYIRLTGFGPSLFECKTPYYGFVGYTECLPPEMLLNQGVDKQYDFWMLGCLLYELLEGHPPFQASTVSQTLQKILVGELTYVHASPEAQQFVNSFLTANPNHRLGSDMEKVRCHNFLKDVDWENIAKQALPSPFARINKTGDPTCFCCHFKEDIVDEAEMSVDCHNTVFVSMLH